MFKRIYTKIMKFGLLNCMALAVALEMANKECMWVFYEVEKPEVVKKLKKN